MKNGNEMYKLAQNLWPINRSITGSGVRETLKIIQSYIPELKIKHFNTGLKVFDWEIPQEWRVKRAYIISPEGKKFCDFSTNNLHLIGYSDTFIGEVTLDELQKHLYSIPEKPNSIPYITSYYEKRWGFCISENERKKLKKGIYEVVIESEFFDGVLNYGEIFIAGNSKKEIFLSTYICHPSMANNELSGPTVTTFLVKWLKTLKSLEFSYRIIFIPETIGSIAYLSSNLYQMKKNIKAGFNITCIGDDRTYSYLPSRSGNSISDKVAKHILKWIYPKYKNYSWLNRGSDERQYCSPGVDLPIATIMRSKFGEYPEYHTSDDNLIKVVSAEGLYGGYEALRKALELLENNAYYSSKFLGEPNLGSRGLYPTTYSPEKKEKVWRIMNFLTYCDKTRDLIDIAEILNCPAWELYEVVKILKENELIEN